jgi:hypothetical protein
VSHDLEKTYRVFNTTLSVIFAVLLVGAGGYWLYQNQAPAGKSPGRPSHAWILKEHEEPPGPFSVYDDYTKVLQELQRDPSLAQKHGLRLSREDDETVRRVMQQKLRDSLEQKDNPILKGLIPTPPPGRR